MEGYSILWGMGMSNGVVQHGVGVELRITACSGNGEWNCKACSGGEWSGATVGWSFAVIEHEL